MKRHDSRLLAGLILFVVGAAGAVYGIVSYTNERNSLGGRIRGLFNAVSDEQKLAMAFIVGGAALAVIGILLVLLRGRRRR